MGAGRCFQPAMNGGSRRLTASAIALALGRGACRRHVDQHGVRGYRCAELALQLPAPRRQAKLTATARRSSVLATSARTRRRAAARRARLGRRSRRRRPGWRRRIARASHRRERARAPAARRAPRTRRRCWRPVASDAGPGAGIAAPALRPKIEQLRGATRQASSIAALMRTLVTGGSGYVGACVVEELLAGPRRPRARRAAARAGRDRGRAARRRRRADRGRRARPRGAPAGAGGRRRGGPSRRHRGDPACARDPATSQAVNVDATRELVGEAARRGRPGGSCSRRPARTTAAWPTDGADRRGRVLAPVSLYAEQKVAVERHLLGRARNGFEPCCLRFATVYGVAPRMRFDLTVNEFTRDLWADRQLEVFGEQFWRPYVHVRDAARGVRIVLDAARRTVAGEVFNVGRSGGELPQARSRRREIQAQLGPGSVEFVRRDEDPRDYKVSFDKMRSRPRLRDHDDRARRHRRGRRRARARARSRTRSTRDIATEIQRGRSGRARRRRARGPTRTPSTDRRRCRRAGANPSSRRARVVSAAVRSTSPR